MPAHPLVRLSILGLVFASAAPAQDSWPKYRGVHGDGAAAPQPLADSWGAGGPPEVWRRPLGSGFSTIAIGGERLYTMGASGESEAAICIDAKTGDTVWETPLGELFTEQFGDGPRATPTLDGELVFVATSRMRIAALKAADGSIVWEKDLLAEHGLTQPRFGYSPSFVVAGNCAVIEIGAGEGKAIAAYERATGKVLWTALDGPAGASTPLLAEIEGVPQLIFNRRPDIAALSLDGEVLWTFEGAPDSIAMAQLVSKNLVFTSSAYMGQGGVMLEITKGDEGFAAKRIWGNRRFRNHFNNSVAVDGFLYGFDNSTLRCINGKSGDIEWSSRGLGKGSVMACGELLFVLGDQGTLVMAAADPEAYRELGRVQALEGRCWTSPTLANGRLYLRNLEELVVYDVSPQASASPVDVAEVAKPQVTGQPTNLELDAVLAAYAKARGGARWAEVKSLQLTGEFSAFSQKSNFLFRRHRDGHFRFDFGMIGQRDARGKDAEGLWWQFNLFGATSPARGVPEPYHKQMEREAMFEPALLNAAKKGIKVKLLGAGSVDAQATVDLELTFPDESVETWKLHPETGLEVAIDATIVDMTQDRKPMTRRTFFSDFREVDGLVLPFALSMEFGARLEEIVVQKAEVDPELGDDAFVMPDKIK